MPIDTTLTVRHKSENYRTTFELLLYHINIHGATQNPMRRHFWAPKIEDNSKIKDFPNEMAQRKMYTQN